MYSTKFCNLIVLESVYGITEVTSNDNFETVNVKKTKGRKVLTTEAENLEWICKILGI